MYGIVNRSMESLVLENYGQHVWDAVKRRSGIDIDFFISNEPYDDALTFKLAIGISEEMEIPLADVLFLFGEWWILHTTNQKYKGLLQSGGKNLKEFLINLPKFHSHLMLLYPKLTPPEFSISDIQESSLNVHYFSKRDGLKDFVKGLLSGLGKLYETPVAISELNATLSSNNQAILNVTWQ